MKADYKIGICFSNEDPQNLGRIRAISIDVLGKAISLKDIQEYVKREDDIAVATLKYNPWYSTKYQNFSERDKYVCEPFLPKNIGVTPNAGQLVKIITYEDLSQKLEFIGPYTIDQVTLTEEYRNVVNNLQKTIPISEVIPKKGKTFFSGYTNEQIILGDNELLIRLNHINQGAKTRKTSYPFIQLSQFSNSYNVNEKTTTITENPDIPIDFICEMFLKYTPKKSVNDKNFTAELVLYDASKQLNRKGELGLTRDTYSPKTQYISSSYTNYTVKHYINSSNYNEFLKIIDEIISGYNSGGVIKYYDINNTSSEQKTENNITTIIVYNNVPATPNAGGALSDSNIVSNIKSWMFRLNPSINLNNYQGTLTRPNLPENNIESIKYRDFAALDSLISKYSVDKKYGKLAINNPRTTTVTKPVAESANKPQSVYTVYSDKFLFLSSLNSLNIVDNLNFDGLPSDKIARILSGLNQNERTYGFIRGEKLMELLNEILDMFKKHGHQAGVDPTASIVQSTQEAVENIKKKIKDELKEGQNNVIINHNLRLN